MNIFQIKQELLSIFDELEENGGELTEELASQLKITQESFRNKIESYANVIKSINADIDAIDVESKRLASLKKSKQSVVNRLNNIMIDAIEMFGDTSKSGSKFIDYGTGKVSIRNTFKCELDDNKLECIINEFGRSIANEVMLGAASNREDITFEDIIQRCSEHKSVQDGEVIDDYYFITKDDLANMVVEITTKHNMSELLSHDGYNFMKGIMSFDNFIKITPKIDKTALKKELLDNDDITIGKLVENKTIQIK